MLCTTLLILWHAVIKKLNDSFRRRRRSGTRAARGTGQRKADVPRRSLGAPADRCTGRQAAARELAPTRRRRDDIRQNSWQFELVGTVVAPLAHGRPAEPQAHRGGRMCAAGALQRGGAAGGAQAGKEARDSSSATGPASRPRSRQRARGRTPTPAPQDPQTTVSYQRSLGSQYHISSPISDPVSEQVILSQPNSCLYLPQSTICVGDHHEWSALMFG